MPQATTRFMSMAAILMLCVGLGLGAASSAGAKTKKKAPVQSTKGTFTHADCARNQAAGQITYLSPAGYQTGPGTMDVYMAGQLGYFKTLCLNVSYQVVSSGSQALVSAGTAQATSITSAANAMADIGNGDNFVGVSTMGQSNTTAIVTRSSITKLTQLQGGTIGYTNNIGASTLALLTNAGVNVNNIQFIKLTSRALTPIENQVDGIVATTYSGPQLASLRIPYHLFGGPSYGVKGTSNVILFNTTWEQGHRAAIADFIRADLKAINYCLTPKGSPVCVQDMTSAAAANGEGSQYPFGVENATWALQKQIIEQHGTKPLGLLSPAVWEPEFQLAQKYGPIEGKIENIPNDGVLPAIGTMLYDGWASSVYTKKGQLIWP